MMPPDPNDDDWEGYERDMAEDPDCPFCVDSDEYPDPPEDSAP